MGSVTATIETIHSFLKGDLDAVRLNRFRSVFSQIAAERERERGICLVTVIPRRSN